jgi:23S rRNA-/tRNA-specific pseudouridylate synthase
VFHPDERLGEGARVKVLLERGRGSGRERVVEGKEIGSFDEWKRAASATGDFAKPFKQRVVAKLEAAPKPAKVAASSSSLESDTIDPRIAKKLERKDRRRAVLETSQIAYAIADIKSNRILKRTDSFLFLDKPDNLHTQPGSQKTSISLVGLLPSIAAEGEDLRLVSRLDRDTTGVIAVARNTEAAKKLGGLLAEHTEQASDPEAEEGVDAGMVKEYLALLAGDFPAGLPESGTVHGHISVYGPERNQAMRHHAEPDIEADSKPAVTSYRVLLRHPKGTLILLRPHTGRKHQLRAFAVGHFGTYVVGDWRYGPRPRKNAGDTGSRMCLHCARLTVDGETGVAPLPETWKQRCEERGIVWETVQEAWKKYDEQLRAEGVFEGTQTVEEAV